MDDFDLPPVPGNPVGLEALMGPGLQEGCSVAGTGRFCLPGPHSHLWEEPPGTPACLALLPGSVPSRQVSVHTLTSLSRVSAPLSDAVTISSFRSSAP